MKDLLEGKHAWTSLKCLECLLQIYDVERIIPISLFLLKIILMMFKTELANKT